MTRQRITGKSQKGDWEMLKVEVQGQECRIQSEVINDPAGIPPVGDFICLPAFIGTNGQLREAKQLNSQAF
jgi:hypothetical protein